MIVIDCPFCIDGLMPAGTDGVFGPCFVFCPACHIPCEHCGGTAVYPAMRGYFEYLIDALYHLGFEVDLCRGCLGGTGIYKLGEAPK